MKTLNPIEHALAMAVAAGEAPGCPPKLAGAIRHAVFPGGARIRPRVCLAVAGACGNADPELASAAATAIELLHCASLVHDDLPCFDNAPTRRGRASVQYAYGESLAVLAGDALIVLAFQTLTLGATASPQQLPALLMLVSQSVGMPFGAIAGQAWESEPKVNLSDYQRAKTGALFAATAMGGAIAAGADPAPWRAFGDWLGEAYQAADDIRDVVGDPRELGKPVGRDVALLRPSAAVELGLQGAIAYFDILVARAIDAIPVCPGSDRLRELVCSESERLVPKASKAAAASAAAVQAAV
ncbi:MAG: polyprenyl synthetase family protein [Comamonadaceae bacterium]|nr:MAG: polyprenyl synthetase family protein [Comamonadaceae bacterium]